MNHFSAIPAFTFWAGILSGYKALAGKIPVKAIACSLLLILLSVAPLYSLAQNTFTITGTITSSGSPVSGANVVASGDHSQSVTTNAAGQFTFTNVAEGSYISITPSFSNYSFLPASLSLSNITQNISGQDFIADQPGLASVSGQIVDIMGNPVGGVSLTASGDLKLTVISNQSGYYQFYGNFSGRTRFSISPELTGYTFDPESINIDRVFNASQGLHFTGQNFTAIPGVLPYFSRQNGSWNNASTWSNTGHSGAASAQSPGPDDEAVIGEGHIVTLTTNVSTNLTGKVTVNPAGTLVTNQYLLSGSGSFVLNPGGTLHIGSAQGILASGNGGSIRTASRSFSTQAGYVYDGSQAQQTGDGLPANVSRLRIDNPSGVSASGSLQISEQLQLDNGLLIMPPGSSLAAANTSRTNGNVRMQLNIQGGKGWRMISSPVNTSYSDLLNGFVSQGFSGTANPAQQANLMWFDETESGTTNMAWRAPGALSNNVPGGRGHFFYIFNGEGGYSDNLPITMDATGIEFITGSASYDFNVTRTPRIDVEDTETEALNAGWNIVGNPSTATLNWDAAGGWTKSNIDNTFYVWDQAANGGMGDFKYWNGTDGTLGDGLIAPFQGFWIRANTYAPSLRVNVTAKTTGGTFIGNPAGKSADKSLNQDAPSALELTLTADGMETASFISFNHDGQIGEDRKDAYRLEAMNDSWLKLFTTSATQHLPMVINNLPADFGEVIHLPLYAAGQREGSSLGGSYKLQWRLPDNWPSHWMAYLMDHQQKTSIPMYTTASEIVFELPKDNTSKTTEKKQESVFMPAHIISGKPKLANMAPGSESTQKAGTTQDASALRTSQVSGSPRFSIVIFSATPEGDVEYMPAESVLFPVFPNPVQDQASIKFNLPAEERVSIEVYNIQGKLLEVVTDQQYGAGIHRVSWMPYSLPQGIYMAVMRTNSMLLHQKMILMR
jgi:hypothetical protein